jgi:hypothetical protein
MRTDARNARSRSPDIALDEESFGGSFTGSILAPHTPPGALQIMQPSEIFEFGIDLDRGQINDLIACMGNFGGGQARDKKTYRNSAVNGTRI